MRTMSWQFGLLGARHARPHPAVEWPISPEVPRVRRIEILGGLIHEYEPVAA